MVLFEYKNVRKINGWNHAITNLCHVAVMNLGRGGGGPLFCPLTMLTG